MTNHRHDTHRLSGRHYKKQFHIEEKQKEFNDSVFCYLCPSQWIPLMFTSQLKQYFNSAGVW